MIIYLPPYIICWIDFITYPFPKLLDHHLFVIRCTHNTSILSNAVWNGMRIFIYILMSDKNSSYYSQFISPNFPSFSDLEFAWPRLVCTRMCKWDERNIKNKDNRNPLFSIWLSGACDHILIHTKEGIGMESLDCMYVIWGHQCAAKHAFLPPRVDT